MPAPPSSRRAVLTAGLSVAGLGSLAGCAALASDADRSFPDTDWPMAGGDPANAAFLSDGAVPGRVEERWSVRVGTRSVSSPVVGGGSAFVASEGYLRAFRAADGESAWNVRLSGDDGGTLGTPAYDADAGAVYVAVGGERRGGGDGGDGTGDGDGGASVRAFDAAAGDPLWTATVGAESAYAVRVADGELHVRTADACVALDAERRGEELWRRDGLGPVAAAEYNVDDAHAGDVAPTVAGERVYVPADGAILALDRATGEERWRVPLESAYAAPAVRDGTVYAQGYTRTKAVAADGRVEWTYDGGELASPAAADDAVYVVDGDVVELDPTTGEERWRWDLRTDVIAAQPVVVGECVVAVGNRSAALARERPLLGLGSRPRWTLPGEASDVTSPAVGAGRLFAVDYSAGGRLVAYG